MMCASLLFFILVSRTLGAPLSNQVLIILLHYIHPKVLTLASYLNSLRVDGEPSSKVHRLAKRELIYWLFRRNFAYLRDKFRSRITVEIHEPSMEVLLRGNGTEGC